MKRTKRILALLLSAVLTLSLLPTAVFAAGADYTTKLRIDKAADGKVDVKWMLQTANEANVVTCLNILFKYDNTKYELLDNDGNVIDLTGKTMSNNLCDTVQNEDEEQNVTTFVGGTFWTNSGIYAQAKGNDTFVLMQLLSTKSSSKTFATETQLAVVHLKLKDGVAISALPGGSIALATKTEANDCGQSGIVVYNAKEGTSTVAYFYGATDEGAVDSVPAPTIVTGEGVSFARATLPDTAAVSISGTLKYGQTLTASLTDVTDPGPLTYAWYREGVTDPIKSGDGDEYKSYTTVAEDVNKTIKVVVSAANYSGSKDATTGTIAKADGPEVPSGGELSKSESYNCIRVKSYKPYVEGEGYKYDISGSLQFACVLKGDSVTDETSWYDTEITGLTASTEYDLYARYKETATHTAGTSKQLGTCKTGNAPISSVSVTLAAPVKGTMLATKGEVTVAASDSGKYEVESVTWYEGSSASDTAVIGKAKANTVYTVKIILKAKNRDFADSVTADGYTVTRDKNTQLTLTKTFTETGEKELSSITVSGTTTTVDVPTKGNTATVTLTATANYDDDSSADVTNDATWSITSGASALTVDKGVVTVKPSASAGKITVEALYGGKSGTYEVMLNKAEAELTTLTVTGAISIDVPTAADGNYQTTYTVAGEDQYGTGIATGVVTWSVEGADSAVTINASTGELTVPYTATGGNVTVKATVGSGTAAVTGTLPVTINRAGSEVDSVRISDEAPASVTVPEATAPNTFDSTTRSYTATVYDQYGNPMTGESVKWSVSAATGVIIDETTGELTVCSNAAGGNVTVTATSATNNAKSDLKVVSLGKSTTLVPKFVRIFKGETETEATDESVTIPTGSSNVTRTYTAQVYDQYGAPMDGEAITWSISEVAGVTQSLGTVTVTSSATEGTAILTAASSTASSVKATVNIALSSKPRHNIGTFATGSLEVTYCRSVAGQTVSSSTGSVRYSSSDTSIVEVNANTGTLTIHKVTSGAPVTITAKVAETDTCAEATATYTVTVNKKELSITGLTAVNRDYEPSNTTVALENGTMPGVVSGDEVSVTIPTTGTITDASAGSGKAVTVVTPTLTGAHAGNYTLKDITGITVTINKADPDVGTVSGPSTAIYPATALTDITLSKTGSAAGTLALAAGQTLTVGEGSYNWTFTPSDTTNYNTATGTVSLTVSADTLTGISIGSTAPTKTAYKYGESFETAGLTVTATYASGATQNVTESVTFGALAVGQTSIQLSYQGKTCTVSGLTVNKADAWTLTDIAVSQNYTVTSGEKTLGNVGMPANAGTLTYSKGTASTTGTVSVGTDWNVDSTGKVTYTLSGGAAGDTVTLPVVISSANYADSTVNVVITLTAKQDQTALTINSASSVTYGQPLTLSTTGGSGTGTVTYEIVSGGTGEASIDGAVLTTTKAGTVLVKATKAADDTYEAVSSESFTVTINKAKPTGTPGYTAITASDKTLADAALTVGSITPTGGTIAWDDANDTVVAANTAYGWTYTPADETNYETLTGTLTPYTVSYSGGGSSSASTYSVTVEKTKNGDVSVSPKSAEKGETVTITATPDAGYAVEDIVITDRSGNKVKFRLKGGKYTFEMPGSGVTVKVSFARSENPFVDVPEGKYFYDAVMWAVENGITGGTDATHFSPYASCTRGQLVTFLWRAAGQPEVKASENPFTDVRDSSSFYKAILWASENGIVNGYSDGSFKPGAAVSRQQTAAILYRYARYAKMDVSVGEDTNILSFNDALSVSEYAVSALQWAVGEGVITGNNGNLLPHDTCTRAQIVTMLYRSIVK